MPKTVTTAGASLIQSYMDGSVEERVTLASSVAQQIVRSGLTNWKSPFLENDDDGSVVHWLEQLAGDLDARYAHEVADALVYLMDILQFEQLVGMAYALGVAVGRSTPQRDTAKGGTR